MNNLTRIKNVTILGYGISGKAAETLCLKRNIKCTVIAGEDVPLPNDFSNTDMFIVSPGLPPAAKLYKAAAATGIKMVSEIEFASFFAPCRILAITGTNGKTTTTELTVHLLQSVGIDARPAGNIGVALSEAVIAADTETILVVEVSSFQLELCHDFAPYAAVLLNIASDHLERYNCNIDQYLQAKLKIFNHVNKPARRIIGLSLMNSPILPEALKSSCAMPMDAMISPSETNMSAFHNIENLTAALSLVKTVIDQRLMSSKKFISALKSFKPGAHRLEQFLCKNNIRYIDDSKATNPAAVVAAVNSLSGSGNIRIILGGLDKEMNFAELDEVCTVLKKAYVTGACRDKISAVLAGKVEQFVDADFDTAVKAACGDARPGDTVLLSPGCASMDCFDNYRQRGEHFKKICQSQISNDNEM